MAKIITTAQELKDHVRSEYLKHDTELNSLFFDVQVRMPESEILQAYADIQKSINGDEVIRLSGVIIETEDLEWPAIWGRKEQLIPDGCYTGIYEGSCREFLESFNGREAETGLCRLMELMETPMGEGFVGGDKLDFIF